MEKKSGSKKGLWLGLGIVGGGRSGGDVVARQWRISEIGEWCDDG